MGNVKFSAIAAAGAMAGADTLIGVQSGTTDVQYTFANAALYIGANLDVARATSLAIGGATIGTDAIAWTGTATGSGRLTVGGVNNTANGAASTASSLMNGTLFTGGTGTTTFPQILVQPTGTSAVTTWSTSGTILGANVGSGFAGNFLDFHVSGGASQFLVNSIGSVTSGGSIRSAVNFNITGTSILTGPSAGTWQFGAPDAASPVAQTLRVQSVVTSTSNANGTNWTHIGSLSTGSGTSGDMIFQTGVAPGGGSPTVQATATTALTIKGETQAVVVASGKTFQIGNAAATGLVAGVLAATTNASIVITDSTGQAYRIPCII